MYFTYFMELVKCLRCYFTTGIDWNSNTATNENWRVDDTQLGNMQDNSVNCCKRAH